jgi:hypothetical protein
VCKQRHGAHLGLANQALCRALVIGAILCSGQHAHAIVNYEKDPSLELAIGYDSELNGGDRTRASHELAERDYLAYLKRATDSFQRARVYVQLGVLFNTTWHPEYGENPDYPKARRYLSRALEEEPKRIGWATIRARLGLIGVDTTPDENFSIRMKFYDWLMSADADAVGNLWLPKRLDEKPTELNIRTFMNVIADVDEAESLNLAHAALATSNPSESLASILRTFKGTNAARAAQRLIDQRKEQFEQIVNEVVTESIDRFGDVVPLKETRVSTVPGANGATVFKSTRPTRTNAPTGLMTTGKIIAWSISVALVCVVAAVLFIRRRPILRRYIDLSHHGR